MRFTNSPASLQRPGRKRGELEATRQRHEVYFVALTEE
jgi:hypothetical protein